MFRHLTARTTQNLKSNMTLEQLLLNVKTKKVIKKHCFDQGVPKTRGRYKVRIQGYMPPHVPLPLALFGDFNRVVIQPDIYIEINFHSPAPSLAMDFNDQNTRTLKLSSLIADLGRLARS
jgi:hypothetical protein